MAGLILLTGATGYIGGRLLPELERKGLPVRCLARRPEYLAHRVAPGTEIAAGDVFDPQSLAAAMQGVHTAYYLVHSLGGSGAYASRDREAAESFGREARKAAVSRIIYLGGLGTGGGLSEHLASRQEVGAVLRRSGVPTLEFRASIVIGAGSLSFEMVRALVQRLPIMTMPRWVRTLAQPIAIADVLAFLLAALDYPTGGREECGEGRGSGQGGEPGESDGNGESRVYEIGGADRVSYEGIMREYAAQRGLRRLIVPVPVLSPGLSGLWLALVTPLYYQVGRRLIEGVRNETVVTDPSAGQVFGVQPMGIREAIRRALEDEDRQIAGTRWSDALPSRSLEQHWGGVRFGIRLVDSRETRIGRPPAEVFRPVQCIGGKSGWYAYDWLWSLRGALDKVLGGVGSQRTPRDPRCLLPGDTVGFWRVEALQPGRLLRLRAEMKLPGRAWLQFEVEEAEGGSTLRQTAIFDPVGLGGLLYWYALYPLHTLIFRRMLGAIAAAALSGEPV